jgi:ribonuclease Y
VDIWIPIVSGIAGIVIGLFVGYMYRKSMAEAKLGRAEEVANKLLNEAEEKAEAKKKETILEAREEIHKQRTALDREIRERRAEIQRIERRLQQKEDMLDKKSATLESKEEIINQTKERIAALEEKTQELYNVQLAELERISGLSVEAAREALIRDIEKEARYDAAVMIREIENEARNDAAKRAREIIGGAIQKCAADHVAESTVSVVPLPSDDMKGRIIGREGRNIRALETATGIDFIIDDTPEAVILSGFDPIRREVARIALEKLIVDGRIHPARIEELVAKARKEVETKIREAGESAVF